MMISTNALMDYVEIFNGNDEETVVQYIGNRAAGPWLAANIPLLDCPDKDIEETYYFRWWVYRKHIKSTPDGFIVTEFHPDVPWAGNHNAIVASSSHHIYEGRWLRDGGMLEQYARFWFRPDVNRRLYSSWLADALWQYCLAKGDFSLIAGLLAELIMDYSAWEASNRHACGLYWTIDDRDGGEFSISGNGLRPTMNSYQYAHASAIANTAELLNRADIAHVFKGKAIKLKALMQTLLWDGRDEFFKVLPLDTVYDDLSAGLFSGVGADRNVRELHGFVPWYFNIPDEGYESAWKQLFDPSGFQAPCGPTTAEQRHPLYMASHKHECLWNGPSWPYATSQTLVAMANLLNNYRQSVVKPADYLRLLGSYARCHHRTREDGTRVNWIDENLDPYTGDWISRAILLGWGWPKVKGGYERGKDYNHSTFCDLVITGLAGLRPRQDNILEVNPLIDPEWSYFCIDRISYHGHDICIAYDRDGSRYRHGKGLSVYVSGVRKAVMDRPGRVLVELD